MKPFAFILPVSFFLTTLTACMGTRTGSASASYFESHVKPVLQTHCLRCHNNPAAPAGLDLSNKQGAFAARSTRFGRPYIVPGDSDCSLLVLAISRNGTHPKVMPRLEVSLTEDQIGDLREWIDDGAHWPEGAAGQLQPVPSAENP